MNEVCFFVERTKLVHKDNFLAGILSIRKRVLFRVVSKIDTEFSSKCVYTLTGNEHALLPVNYPPYKEKDTHRNHECQTDFKLCICYKPLRPLEQVSFMFCK